MTLTTNKLTNKQEKFCKAIALEGMNQSDAYRGAYPTCLKWKSKSINEQASVLMKNNNVLTRIKELKDSVTEKTIEKFAKSRDDILTEYESIKNNSVEPKIKIDCLKEQGKILGYYEDNLNVKGSLDLQKHLSLFKKRAKNENI